jgi:hypothetical protein
MNYIKSFLIKFISKELPKPLGRWKIENCSKKINNKIDLSNEDHCGPCGQYVLKKLELKNNNQTIEIHSEKLENQKHN